PPVSVRVLPDRSDRYPRAAIVDPLADSPSMSRALRSPDSMTSAADARDPGASRGGVVTSTVEFVETAFPLVLVRLPRAMSSPELQVLFAGFDRVQKQVRERRALYYVVIDGLALAKLPTPVERKMLTDWMSEPARSELECQY